MRASIQRLACIFAVINIVFNPGVNVNGADNTKEMEQILPVDYKPVIGSDATVLNKIWGEFSVRYTKSSDHAVSIILSGPYNQGWLGIGLSKTGSMIGSSAMVGWTGAGGKNMIKQYSLEGYSPSKVIANKGELQLTKVTPACAVSKGTIYLAFQLKFPDNNMKQKVIFASSPTSPEKDITLTMHKEMSVKEIDFSKGAVASNNSVSMIKAAHGILGLLAWQLLIPMGIICARFFKHHDPLWFYLHITCQCTGYIFTIINIILGLKLAAAINKTITWHRYIGILVLVLASLQLLALVARPAKDSSKRGMWNNYHHSVGLAARIMGGINVLLGILMAHGGWIWRASFSLLLFADAAASAYLTSKLQKRDQESHEHKPPVFSVAS